MRAALSEGNDLVAIHSLYESLVVSDITPAFTVWKTEASSLLGNKQTQNRSMVK